MTRITLFLLLIAGCESATTPPAPFVGSGLGPDEIPLKIDLKCPGDPSCPDVGDGKLWAGTGKRDITPLVEPFVDLNHNNKHDYLEPYTDLNGNGQFDPVFLAGRDSGTFAFAVHDPIWVRCYALKQNQTTLVHCVVDALGYFVTEEQQIRANLDPALGVDLLMMAATHDHQSKDMIGIWGPDDTSTGYDDAYMKWVRSQAVAAITDAVKTMKPAKMRIGAIATQEPNGDMSPYVSDTRDPVVIDPWMHIMQFDGLPAPDGDGKPIVTVANWGSHPDSLGSDRHYVSSEWVHYFRQDIEAGTGSDVVFVQGQCGGQVGPGDVKPFDENGDRIMTNNHDFRFVEAWGRELARMALKAYGAAKTVDNPKLRFRHTSIAVHVENLFYHTAANLNLFGPRSTQFYGYDPKKAKVRDESGDNAPVTDTEIAYIELGPAAMITSPGELLPENFLGGYDGSYSGGFRFIDTQAPNAPDPDKAPKAPYLRDMMAGPNGEHPLEHRMVLGLTLDFLGYIVPRYNFVLDDFAPYVARAAGDHYEETNSVGPRAEPEMVGTMRQLVLSANADAK